jgi:ribonuclease P protein component
MTSASSPGRSPAAPDRRLRPTERIQRPLEFQTVMRGGRTFRDPIVRIHFRENGRELSRLGLVVSKKMGGAVERNRLKRIYREIFREVKRDLPVPLDLVIVPNFQPGPRDRASYQAVFERFVAWQRSRAGGAGRAP